jgi:hypothetical protein
MLDDFDELPDRGDLIDQVAHRHDRFSEMKQEVAELKARTDFKGLLTWLGFEVKKNGRGWKILCPFHNDTDPSCSVNLEKGLFHCFGCGVEGDKVKFVKLYKQTDFKGVIEVFKQYNGLTGGRQQGAEKKTGKQHTVPKPVEKQKPPGTDITFETIADYYHKKLYENK